MNTNNVVSLAAAGNLTGKEYRQVKLTSTGVDIAASGDVSIGTLLRAQNVQEDGVYLGKAVAVQLKHGSIHYAMIGASSAAVAIGAGMILDSANPGMLVPSESSPIARSVQAFTAASGGVFQIIYL